jgi:hypothetical protein
MHIQCDGKGTAAKARRALLRVGLRVRQDYTQKGPFLNGSDEIRISIQKPLDTDTIEALEAIPGVTVRRD